MHRNEQDIERTIEFARGRVEIRNYNWRGEWHGVRRARPDMYIFELNLSAACQMPPGSRRDRDATPELSQIGEIAFIPPQDRVLRHMAAGWRRALLCMFERDWLDTLLPPVVHRDGSSLVEIISLGRIEWLLRNIYREMRQQEDFGSAIVVESFANALVVELIRCMASRGAEDGARKGGLAPWRMRLLKKRILSNTAAPSLTELAELCDMTVRHLCRAFKAETGITPGQYVDAVRAQHARDLLCHTNLSLTDIAHRLGFSTSASFSNAFQRATGLKPRQIDRWSGSPQTEHGPG